MIEIITQFFKSNDLKRQEEIDRCFNENINNKFGIFGNNLPAIQFLILTIPG